MQFIPASAIAQVWGDAEPMLRAVLAKTGEDWTPEHVRAALDQGKAILFMAPGSMLVAVPRECEFTGRRELYIWAAAGGFRRHIGWVMSHARENGFARVGFDSPRKGWGRRFKEGQTYFYAEV